MTAREHRGARPPLGDRPTLSFPGDVAAGEGRREVVLWSLAGALLAAPVASVREVAPTGDDGRARTRSGEMEITPLPGLDPPGTAPRAVVVDAGGLVLALAAEVVEGVVIVDDGAVTRPPRWLTGLNPRHVRGLVSLGPRVAALLRLDAIAAPE